ncbi:MAG: glycosyltransferase [Chthoniobacterales bacterium]|nr:glycosyltransferase [Chthoniobacterales bacterium]
MPSALRPVVASYCATFLKPEMLHIYRQIIALERFQPVVIARKREEAKRLPFSPVFVVPRSATHFLRRFWFRNIRHAPWRMSAAETARIERVLAANDAQLLHIYFGHIAVHLLPLMQRWPKPVVVSFHGADVLVDLEKPRYRAATREMLAAARLVLVRSESLVRAIVELGCEREKIRVHRTGIPLGEIPFRRRIWPNDGSWRFLQAGRLMEKKGLTTSLRAFATFRKEHPRATFTIAGDGPMLEEFTSLAQELGLGNAVNFAGFLSQAELRAKFEEAHIFLHPSQLGRDGNQEGVPNAMLEAMASGLPVFATRHGGIPEAIEDGVSGVLLAERDHEGLARALFEWTNRPDALSALAQGGAAAVAQRFEQGAQARALEGFYLEALGRAT